MMSRYDDKVQNQNSEPRLILSDRLPAATMDDDDNEHEWGAFLQFSIPLEAPRWGAR